jgi:hypothetical protein
MLKPDDIYTRHFEFHADFVALHGNVERPAAMLMGPEFPVRGLRRRWMRSQGAENNDCA